jgi:hypothetical protein
MKLWPEVGVREGVALAHAQRERGRDGGHLSGESAGGVVLEKQLAHALISSTGTTSSLSIRCPSVMSAVTVTV